MKPSALRRMAASIRKGTRLKDEQGEVAAQALEWIAEIPEDFVQRIKELRAHVENEAGLEDPQRSLLLAQLDGALMARTEDLRFRYLESVARSLAPDRRPGQDSAKKRAESLDEFLGGL